MRSTIAELQAAGVGKNNLNSTIAAFAVIGMGSSTPYWFSHDGPEMISEVGNHFALIFCHGALEEPPADKD